MFRTFLIALFLMPLSATSFAATETDLSRPLVNPHLTPDPKYSPREVVEIQMQAMMHNSVPYADAGIEITFRFASPTNRLQTGPLDKFIQLVNNVAYAPMLDAESVEYGKTHTTNEGAQIPVVVTANDGSRAGYLFTLSKQVEAPYENCWMTDAVVRFRLKDDGDAGST